MGAVPISKIILPEWLFHPGNEELRRIAVIAYTSVFIAVVSITIFSILRLLQHDYVLGFVDLSFAVVLAGIILYHRKTKKFDDYLTLFVGVTVYGMFCIYLFFFFELGKATFLWSYTFPLTVFPILGSRRGIIAVVLFLIPISLLLIVGPSLSFITSYPRGFAFPFIPSILAVAGMSYLYERNRERNQQQLKLANIALQRFNEEMEQQVQQRTAELARSEGNYRFLTERMSDIVWTTDLNLNVTYVSPSVTSVLGFTPEEYRRLPLHERLTPEYLAKAMAILASKLAQEKMLETDPERNLQMKLEFCHKDGSIVWMESLINAIRDDEGNLVGVHGVSRDITERKRAQDALVESETLLREAQRVAHMGHWELDTSTMTPTWSEEIFHIFGLDPEEGEPSFEAHQKVTHPDDWDILNNAVTTSIVEGIPFNIEFRILLPDKTIRWLHAIGYPQKDSEGRIASVFGTAQDITYRKALEDALRESEERYRHLVQYAPTGIYEIDFTARKLLSANDVMCQYTGYTREEFMSLDPTQLLTEESKKSFMQRHAKILAGEPVPDDIEYQIKSKNGGVFWVVLSNRYSYEPNNRIIATVIVHDITDRKQAEEELRKSEEYFRAITENATDIILVVDKKGTVTYASPSLDHILGYKPEELIGKRILDLIVPDDRPRAIHDFGKAVLTQGVLIPNVFRVRHNDGSERVLEGVGRNLLDNPSVAGFIMNVRDVTDSRKAEEAMRLHSEILAQIVESVHLIRVDDGVIIYTNPRFDSTFGYDPGELVGKHVSIINPPGGKSPEAVANEIIRSLKQSGGVWNGEVHNIRKDGSSFWCYATVSTFKHTEYGELWISVNRDITLQKQVADALRRSEENYRRSMDESPLGVGIVTEEGETIYANRAILDFCGFDSIDELKATPVMKRYTPESFAESQIRRAKRIRGDLSPSEYEISIVRKDGEIRHLHVFRREVLWDGERQFQVLYDDITERKQAEDALRESEVRFANIFHASPAAIAITRLEDGHLIDVNSAWQKVTGYSREEVIGRTPIELNSWVNPGERDRLISTIREQGTVQDFLFQLRHKSGNVLEMLMSAELIELAGERYMLSLAQDITERKQAEEQLRASLREKEILLREVQHRVKNNMQLISGLLDLQARLSGNPELMEMLREGQRRIQSMVMVHEKLYASKDFARIDLASYVRALSQELFQSYKINPGKIDLTVKTDSVVYVDVNKAIPCGLILNELITNALKHAFSGDGAGAITIIISESDSKEAEIVVRDNGLGLPDDVDIHEPRTVGLYLVNGLVKNQLDGKIEVRQDNGTEFRIKFPL